MQHELGFPGWVPSRALMKQVNEVIITKAFIEQVTDALKVSLSLLKSFQGCICGWFTAMQRDIYFSLVTLGADQSLVWSWSRTPCVQLQNWKSYGTGATWEATAQHFMSSPVCAGTFSHELQVHWHGSSKNLMVQSGFVWHYHHLPHVP